MHTITLEAFTDELTKIAGELQGHTRSGRRPIGVDRLLARESESELTPSDVVDKSLGTVEKQAGRKINAAALLGTGAIGMHVGRKMNEDRKIGKQFRIQQQSGQ